MSSRKKISYSLCGKRERVQEEIMSRISSTETRDEATLESSNDVIELDGQDYSHEVVNSSSNKKRKKVAADDNVKEITRAILEVANALKVGNQAIIQGNEILKESYNYKLPIPQLSGEEIWSMLKECGCDAEKISDIYCLLMSNIDKLRIVVNCPLAIRKEVVMKVVFGSN